MARIVVESEGDRREFPVGKGVVIGRHQDCEILLEDPELSRQHTRVSFEGRAYFVQDLGSRNGTRLNGRRIGQPEMLRPGDVLVIGKTSLRFLLDEDDQGLPEDARTPRAPGETVAAEPSATEPSAPVAPAPAPGPARPAPRDREKDPIVVAGAHPLVKLVLWIVLLAVLAGATYGAKEIFVWALKRAGGRS